MRSIAGFLRRLTPIGICLVLAVSAARADDSPPLHERIDQLLEADALGPMSELADDADFLRRVYLDLAGTIPTADEGLAFFADPAPDKRAKLIDRLLGSPQFVRHMAYWFDAMLTERQPAASIKPPEWHEFLQQSFAYNKPYDQLARELLAADGDDGPLRPAATFYLARIAQPAMLTRDVGRVFFGVDLQCAECHNHPIVENYYQADYYGLFAFLNRSTAFNDAKTKLRYVAEKADGEVSFKSVFTGYSADRVTPRIPKGQAIVEAALAPGDEYLVKPDKNVRSVPKFSRRAELARAATSGQSAAFNRNIVNRLWAQMFGRGIVHPVDLHHPDNPPTHPRLLALLAEEIVKLRFDARAMLRELALTRAYQRSCEPPGREALRPADVAARLPELASEAAHLETLAKASQEIVEKATAELAAVREANAKTITDAEKQASEHALAKKEYSVAEAELKKLEQESRPKQQAAEALREAIAKSKLAVEKLPADKVLAIAVQQIEARFTPVSQEAAALAKSIGAKKEALNAIGKRVKESEAGAKALAAAQLQIQAKQAIVSEAETRAAADKTLAKAAASRLEEAKAIVEFVKITDKAAADVAWQGLVDRWTKRFACRSPKPVSAEELAWSMLQASGQVKAQEDAAAADLKKSPPKEIETALQRAAEIEKRVQAKLVPTASALAAAFTNGAGQSDYEFQPSVTQALFLSNSAPFETLLANGSGTLVARLIAIAGPAELAEQMYMSILTRKPGPDESAAVVDYLKNRDADRVAAVQELCWALLTSTEFRFSR